MMLTDMYVCGVSMACLQMEQSKRLALQARFTAGLMYQCGSTCRGPILEACMCCLHRQQVSKRHGMACVHTCCVMNFITWC